MSTYRVKTPRVQAIRVQKGMDEHSPPWFEDECWAGRITFKGVGSFAQDIPSATIHLPSGATIKAIEGDWIVRYESGELHVWSPDIFNAMFEKVIP